MTIMTVIFRYVESGRSSSTATPKGDVSQLRKGFHNDSPGVNALREDEKKGAVKSGYDRIN